MTDKAKLTTLLQTMRKHTISHGRNKSDTVQKWADQLEEAISGAAPEREPALYLRYVEGEGTDWTQVKELADKWVSYGYAVQSFYTHADPSEVERLRADLAACWAEFKALVKSAGATEKYLSQELTKATTLLQELQEAFENDAHPWIPGGNAQPVKSKLDAFLSATAQPAECDHQWTDDGGHLLICTECGVQEDHDPKWRDMATAPRDGTMLRLLVEFTDHATEDAEQAPTIGANNFDNGGEDHWQFAGWCWSHDHFTEGKGEPVGWLPMFDGPKRTQPAEEVKSDE